MPAMCEYPLIEATAIRLVKAERSTHWFDGETAEVVIRTGTIWVRHWSVRRGGCLFAGSVEMRDLATGRSKAVDVTSEATGGDTHVSYLASLGRKHLEVPA